MGISLKRHSNVHVSVSSFLRAVICIILYTTHRILHHNSATSEMSPQFAAWEDCGVVQFMFLSIPIF